MPSGYPCVNPKYPNWETSMPPGEPDFTPDIRRQATPSTTRYPKYPNWDNPVVNPALRVCHRSTYFRM